MFNIKKDNLAAVIFGIFGSVFLFFFVLKFTSTNTFDKFLSPLAMLQPLQPLKEGKAGKVVFGYLPYWNANKTDSIDFNVLTTLAYFDLKATADGTIDRNDQGYQSFQSRQMTQVFKKAHAEGTRVVATITMMDGSDIESFLDNPDAQSRLVKEATSLVEDRGIDGINLDFEYFGSAGPSYRPKFTAFVDSLTQKMHATVPGSRVSVALYASVKIAPRIYDLGAIAAASDEIFMMAYDFATLSSEVAMPTAPLYGHSKNKWWYDVSTAVEDFLTVMPPEKLILGNPYYGLNFPVVQPEVKAATLSAYWGGAEHVTYAADKESITPEMQGVTQYKTGWDDDAKVGWKAYYKPSTGVWRMSFSEDRRSLGAKYDFALSKNLGGVGIWALGNDGNNPELWDLIREKFGLKLADNSVINKIIREADHS
ncbi:MAG: glycoside hydrolase family 18 protein [Patescibacteria group bacterium]